jgi:hypothetical protein
MLPNCVRRGCFAPCSTIPCLALLSLHEPLPPFQVINLDAGYYYNAVHRYYYDTKTGAPAGCWCCQTVHALLPSSSSAST